MIITKEQTDLHPLIDGRGLLENDMVLHLYLVTRELMPMLLLESLLIDMDNW